MARYTEIAAQIKRRILDADYFPGDRLPSNRELAAAFATTVVTVRQAISLLAEGGWLRVEHGVGTFVADLGAPGMLASFTSGSIEGGPSLTTRLRSIQAPVSEPVAAVALGLDAQTGLVRLDRARHVADQPVITQSSYLAGTYADLLARYSAEEPLYVFLRDELGLVATRSRETITAVVASPEQAATLGTEIGSALLRSVRVSRTEQGQAFMFDDALILPERLEVEIDRRGTRCQVRFGLIAEAFEPVPVMIP